MKTATPPPHINPRELHRLYWQVIYPFRGRSIRAVALLCVAGLFELLTVLMTAPILGIGSESKVRSGILDGAFARLFSDKGIFAALWVQVALLLFAGVTSGILRWLSAKRLMYLRMAIEKSLRTALMDRLFNMNWTRYHALRGGAVSSSFLMNIWQIGEGIERYLTSIAVGLVICAMLVAATLVSPPLALVAALYGAVAALVSWLITQRASGWMHRTVGQHDVIAVLSQQIMENMKYVQVSGFVPWARGKLRDSFEAVKLAIAQQTRYAELNRLAVEMAGVVFIIIIMVAYRFSGDIAFGTFVCFMGLFYRILPRILTLQSFYYIIRSRGSWLQSRARMELAIGPAVESETVSTAGAVTPKYEREITFNGVTFAYFMRSDQTDAPLILEDLSFTLAKGRFLAVIGESGAGKSTLMDILLGLVRPQRGDVLVDGVSLRTLDLDAWRRQIGYLPQEPFLVAGTIVDNVAFGDPQPDRAKVEECLRLSEAWTFVAAMPQGIDSQIGERGGRLSGGQKQRLALARALFRNPVLLLLDEPTSALDTANICKIRDALARLKGHLTIVMITHQSDLLDLADDVLHLKSRQEWASTWAESATRGSGKGNPKEKSLSFVGE